MTYLFNLMISNHHKCTICFGPEKVHWNRDQSRRTVDSVVGQLLYFPAILSRNFSCFNKCVISWCQYLHAVRLKVHCCFKPRPVLTTHCPVPDAGQKRRCFCFIARTRAESRAGTSCFHGAALLHADGWGVPAGGGACPQQEVAYMPQDHHNRAITAACSGWLGLCSNHSTDWPWSTRQSRGSSPQMSSGHVVLLWQRLNRLIKMVSWPAAKARSRAH